MSSSEMKKEKKGGADGHLLSSGRCYGISGGSSRRRPEQEEQRETKENGLKGATVTSTEKLGLGGFG
ncbi:hypothetical protein HAX54_033911 [Datura stramonium]|uniref:Uncharacterized protein n=1 Tax=Datura stramonium TaxID=4076 RepID=A0ABS8VGP5_DATST|nr:hypothetical protein [Datura stramonium]